MIGAVAVGVTGFALLGLTCPEFVLELVIRNDCCGFLSGLAVECEAALKSKQLLALPPAAATGGGLKARPRVALEMKRLARGLLARGDIPCTLR